MVLGCLLEGEGERGGEEDREGREGLGGREGEEWTETINLTSAHALQSFMFDSETQMAPNTFIV